MKQLILTLILFFQLQTVFPQLMINEMMPKNVSAVMDDDFNFSMWVELYNSSGFSVDQSNFFFTDDLTQPRKWSPSPGVIAQGGYKIVYFEREERPGHANFKLNPKGGVLYLLNSASAIIDQISYPAQYRNCSYGRKTDGSADFTFFENYTPGTANGGRSATEQCHQPEFNIQSGFHKSGFYLEFINQPLDETIYYKLTSDEPTRTNYIRYLPGSRIPVVTSTIVTAKAYSDTKLPSIPTTGNFLIGQRQPKMSCTFINTPQKFLTDPTIGIYVRGTNGIPGNGTDQPANWNQDWDRPANFSFLDTTNTVRLNQELDIKIAGGWTRTMNPQKSLFICPKNKFGENKLKYDFFPKDKPGHKYKDIYLRDAGNDFYHSMMRDGFANALVGKSMDLDYNAYEPNVMYINGAYYGIQNIRERSGSDFIYSNYGLDSDEIDLLDNIAMSNYEPAYLELTNFLKTSDMTNDLNYQKACEMMDMNNFMDYMIAEIYSGNYDWPHNNIKIWRKKDGGKWRWILFDLDFGYGLYNTDLVNVNSLTYALGINNGGGLPEWSTIVLSSLMKNPTFKNHFIDRFSIDLNTVFNSDRINRYLDSISAKIAAEIPYHKGKWGSARDFSSDLYLMKDFGAKRAGNMYGYLSNQFLNSAAIRKVEISSNIPEAHYTMNEQNIPMANLSFNSFKDRHLHFLAAAVPGYQFNKWVLTYEAGTVRKWIPEGSTWKFSDNGALPADNWTSTDYDDSTWKSGQAQLGYGGKGEVTTIGFGDNAQNKYITYYFRKTVTLTKPANIQNVSLNAFVDDGAVIYINGTELGRINMPAGIIGNTTLTSTYNNGVSQTFDVPLSMLHEGDNVIAVEVHQTAANSSDVIFNLSCQYETNLSTESEDIMTESFELDLNGNISLSALYNKSTVSTDNILSENNEIRVYPTRFTDEIRIDQAKGKTVIMSDLSGKIVKTFRISDMYSRISAGALPEGIYLLKIENKVYKMIKGN